MSAHREGVGGERFWLETYVRYLAQEGEGRGRGEPAWYSEKSYLAGSAGKFWQETVGKCGRDSWKGWQGQLESLAGTVGKWLENLVGTVGKTGWNS